jgi:hypothetical protein
MIKGRLEATLKINEFPAYAETVKDGWKRIQIDCDGRVVSMQMRPKAYKKLEDATNWPEWVAVITGKIGPITKEGFELLEPNVQTFEKKPKPETGN